MKTGIVIGTICLLLGAAISFAFFRNDRVRYVDASINITEIRKIKQLHLVEHLYEDVLFIHKGDDTTKAIQAIITVPVKIAGFVNLEQCRFDSVKKEILLPQPQLTEPSYSAPHARHVRRVFFGKPADYINRYANMLTTRKPVIVARAKANKILETSKEETGQYVKKLLETAGLKYEVRFLED